MESYAYKLISLEEITDESPYSVRYRSSDPRLAKSIALHGVIQPVIVTGKGVKTVVAGHKRIAGARMAGLKNVGCLEIQESYSPKDLFLISIYSNLNQTWSDLDRACMLRKALQQYLFDQKLVLEELLPALDLPSEKYVFDQYLEIAGLEPVLLDGIADGKLPFRGSQSLARFSRQDQSDFGRLIANQTALTTNELIKAGEWLYDLLRSFKGGLREFLDAKALTLLLNHNEWDSRQRTEQLFKTLRALRFPMVTEKEKKVEKAANPIFQDTKDIRLEFPPSFEEKGFSLRAKVRDPKSLERILKLLGDRKNSLNSLFEIML